MGTTKGAAACVAVLLAFAACDEIPSQAGPETLDALESRSAEKRVFQSSDEEFAYLVNVVPGGFGGMYFDGQGRPTAFLKDRGKHRGAAGVLGPHVRKRISRHANGRNRSGAIQFLQGQYDFAELARWRQDVDDRLLTLEGMVSTDVDVVRNRVVIGVENATAAQQVRNALAGIGVPAAGVIVEIRERELETATLQERVQLVPGGYEIRYLTPTVSTGVDACSLGFNAYRGGQPVFISASHCTDVKWGSDLNETFWQRFTTISSDKIGYEYYDPQPYMDSSCSTTTPCRWSDAFVGLWTAPSRMDYGRIARTTAPNNGSITIDPLNPTFSIIGEIEYGWVGEEVHRVGRTSGWSTANITNDCVTSMQGSAIHKCTEEAPFSAQSGDSGGPVFSMSGYAGWVYLRGIVWGPRSFSDMFGIERDLGALQTALCNSSNPLYPNC